MFTDEQLLKVLRLEGCRAEPPGVARSLERHLGVVFPETLKRVWLIEDEPTIQISGSYCESSIFGLFALETPHFEFVSQTIRDACESNIWDLKRGLVPIGGEGNGDMLVLDYRTRADPTVLKFDHEIGYRTDEPFYYLAGDFDEFVDRGLPERQAHYGAIDAELTPAELTEILGFPSDDSVVQRERHLEQQSEEYKRKMKEFEERAEEERRQTQERWRAVIEREKESAPDNLPDCPHGHGATRLWSGVPRCWTCGWSPSE